MKIIKKGDENVIKEVEVQCNNCGCQFVYNRFDVEYDFRDGNHVNCPTCGRAIATLFPAEKPIR